MRIHTDPVSRTGRIASIAVATGVTVASALIVLASAGSRFVPTWAPATTRDAKSHSEQLAYLVTAPTPAVIPARPAVPLSARVESRQASASLARERQSKPDGEMGSPSIAGVPRSTTPTQPAVADTGVPWPAPALSPLLWSESTAGGKSSRGMASSSGTASYGATPGAAIDRDAHLRAEALATIAARGAGVPNTRTTSAGGRVDIPLPFSGPSNKQRERERIINAQTMKSLARVLQRLDSVAASRKRRQSDSLAHVEDPMHRDTRSQN